MNIQEFLREINPYSGWHIGPRFWGDSAPSITDNEGLCPVCHVAKRKTDFYFQNHLTRPAARAIGLTEEERLFLVTAADNTVGQEFSRSPIAAAFAFALRNRLLVATGILRTSQ